MAVAHLGEIVIVFTWPLRLFLVSMELEHFLFSVICSCFLVTDSSDEALEDIFTVGTFVNGLMFECYSMNFNTYQKLLFHCCKIYFQIHINHYYKWKQTIKNHVYRLLKWS